MRYVVSIIFLLLVVSFALEIRNFKDSSAYYSVKARLANFFQNVTQFVKVKKHNIFVELFPERKRPITFIKQETSLKMFLPDFFGEFSYADWQKFWVLFYEPMKEKQQGFIVKRYRSKEEVEEYLAYRYSEPFSHFQKQHWDYFWSIVLQK